MDPGIRAFYSGSSGTCMLGVEASVGQTCSRTHLGAFIVFLMLFLSSVVGPLPLGSVVVMRGCTWSTTVFGWVVRVNWHSHECQHPKFSCRTLHCDKMISVIHVTY